jgi:hypothetical protein
MAVITVGIYTLFAMKLHSGWAEVLEAEHGSWLLQRAALCDRRHQQTDLNAQE